MARVLFVAGFNRSGTTLITSAATEAAGATTLTVGDLARHMPSIDDFLKTSREQGTTPDRGVDRLPVTESMPEEYGWLLHATVGKFTFGADAVESGILKTVVDELADGSGAAVVVLKNPWDTGREQFLLDHFPDSQVLLVRRRLGAIEDSLGRAWERMATSNDYIRALISEPNMADAIIGVILDPESRAKTVEETKKTTRRKVLRLARGASKLPLDRVAFLSYDELRDDPRAGAAWAAHLVDPEALSKAVAALTFPEYNSSSPSSWAVRAIDLYWARAWRRARAKQVKAGILTPRKAS